MDRKPTYEELTRIVESDKDFRTPEGVEGQGMFMPGIPGVTSEEPVVVHRMKFVDPVTKRERMVSVVAEVNASQNEIEEKAAEAYENFLWEVRQDPDRKVPTKAERFQVGKALREFRAHLARRKQSTNGKLYYPGAH